MARGLFASSNYVSGPIMFNAVEPITMAAWFYPTFLGSSRSIMSYTNYAAATIYGFLMRMNSTNGIVAGTYENSANSDATTTAITAADTWYHVCTTFTSSTSRASFVNGGSKATNTGSRSVAANPPDTVSIAATLANSGVTQFLPGGGQYIVDAAIWNVVLTDDEVWMLSRGVSPLVIRSDSLIGYWDLVAGDSNGDAQPRHGNKRLIELGTVPDQPLTPLLFRPPPVFLLPFVPPPAAILAHNKYPWRGYR